MDLSITDISFFPIKWNDPIQLTSTLSMQALQVLSLSIHKAKGKSSLTKLAAVCLKKLSECDSIALSLGTYLQYIEAWLDSL